MKYLRYDSHEVRGMIAESTSYSEVLRKLGKSPVGGNITHLANFCVKNNIDTSHMLGQSHARGSESPRKQDPAARLVMRSKEQGRQRTDRLRAGLLALGREEKCEECNNGTEWNGKPIRLEIDHRDRQFWNDEPDNLRFVCPNCHSQV